MTVCTLLLRLELKIALVWSCLLLIDIWIVLGGLPVVGEMVIRVRLLNSFKWIFDAHFGTLTSSHRICIRILFGSYDAHNWHALQV